MRGGSTGCGWDRLRCMARCWRGCCTRRTMLLNPSSVAVGQNGSSVTRLYWPSKNPDDSSHSSSDQATERYKHQRLGHEKLIWKTPAQLAKLTAPQNPLSRTEAQDNSKTQTLSALGHGAEAGPPMARFIAGRCRATRFDRRFRSRLPIRRSIRGSCLTTRATRLSRSRLTSAEKSSARLCCRALARTSIPSAWRRWRIGTFVRPREMARLSLRSRMRSSRFRARG